MKHRHWIFPLLILCLTFLLAGFIVISTQRSSLRDASSTVSDSAYQHTTRTIVKKFLSEFTAATDDSSRVLIVQHTIDALLNVSVPAAFKDLHLELVLRLQAVKSALLQKQNPLESLLRFQETVARSIWLS